MLGFLGFSGVHRLYNRKIFTGLLWLFTFGLFGFGQFIDLFAIPGMVDEYNARLMFRRMFYASHRKGRFHHQGRGAEGFGAANVEGEYDFSGNREVDYRAAGDRQHHLMLKLLSAAEKRGGKLSVTQGVIDTGAPFKDVETTLRDMAKSGYIAVHNDPVSGVVMFDFIELDAPDMSHSQKAAQVF